MQNYATIYSVVLRTLDHWGGVKGQNIFFLKVVMLHIKLNGMERRAPCKHIFCPYTHLQPVGLDQKVKKNSECGYVAFRIKGKEV